MTTSPHMYIQYQFTDIYYYVYASGSIKSYYIDYNYIYFNVTPVTINTSSSYELYYAKNLSLISNVCAKLEYSLLNEPLYKLNVFGNIYTDLNFTYNFENKEKGFIFIKSNNINKTTYTYFYKEVEFQLDDNDEKNDDNDSTLFLVMLFIILGFCVIALFVVIIILIKQELSQRKKVKKLQIQFL